MIVIRPALPGDVADLIALDPIAPVDARRRELILERVDGGQCHVALRQRRIVGYVVLTRYFFQSPFVELLMVAAEDRRSGVGRTLLEHCMGLVSPDEKFWVSTNESNTPMRALLADMGFTPSGAVENIDEGDPELFFLRFPAA